MMAPRPTGLLVPITTPFDETTGDVAPVSLRENVRQMMAAGASGVVAAGSTGEAALIDDREYRQMLGWLRDVVDRDHWLIAGAGRESTRATVAACEAASEEGVDAVLVRSPAYYATSITSAGLFNHFRRVADASPVPILLYNMPKYTNLPLPDSLFSALANHENVWGAKDSSGDLKNFAAYRDAAPDWSMFIGSGALYYAAMELGAVGAVAATACFAAEQTNEIGRAFAAKDKAAAGAIQETVAPLHQGIVSRLGVSGVKAAMDLVGLYGGPVRLPLTPVSQREREGIEQLLSKAGHLVASP